MWMVCIFFLRIYIYILISKPKVKMLRWKYQSSCMVKLRCQDIQDTYPLVKKCGGNGNPLELKNHHAFEQKNPHHLGSTLAEKPNGWAMPKMMGLGKPVTPLK